MQVVTGGTISKAIKMRKWFNKTWYRSFPLIEIPVYMIWIIPVNGIVSFNIRPRQQPPIRNPKLQLIPSLRKCHHSHHSFQLLYLNLISCSPRHVCQINGCGKSYKRIHELHRHQKIHAVTRGYACPYADCNRTGSHGFVRSDHLKQHLKKRHGGVWEMNSRMAWLSGYRDFSVGKFWDYFVYFEFRYWVQFCIFGLFSATDLIVAYSKIVFCFQG